MSLLLPVGVRRMSSWAAHQKRVPRSNEPGTDFYCPIGTPVYAPEDGRVYGWGDSIIPATGRWVGLDLVNGMRWRAMHFSRIALSRTILNNRGFVRRGDLIAYSGASGYGDEDWSWNPNTGGAHTHVTLWPTQETKFGYHRVNGKDVPYTVDFMNYVGGTSGGGTGDEDDMTPEQARMLSDNNAMLSQIIDYLGANGGMNTRTENTIGYKVEQIAQMSQETRDYLGARGGMNTSTADTVGYKIDELVARGD